jgi:hypothetical protein
MRAFKRMIRNFLRWVTRDENNYPEDIPQPAYANTLGGKVGRSNLNDTSHGMNFTVYNATGGKIIQFSSYNPHTDRTTTSLYIVTDQEDLGEEIAQIITKESLTR